MCSMFVVRFDSMMTPGSSAMSDASHRNLRRELWFTISDKRVHWGLISSQITVNNVLFVQSPSHSIFTCLWSWRKLYRIQGEIHSIHLQLLIICSKMIIQVTGLMIILFQVGCTCLTISNIIAVCYLLTEDIKQEVIITSPRRKENQTKNEGQWN